MKLRRAILVAMLLSSLARAGWKPQQLRAGGFYSIHIFDSGIFGAAASGLWKYSERDSAWACIAPGYRLSRIIEGGSGLFAVGQAGETPIPRVYRSRDTGRTWNTLGSGLEQADSAAFAGTRELLSMGRFLIAGGTGTLFRSGDGGDTWERVDTAWEDRYESMAGLLTHGTEVLAVTSRRIYRSKDSGSRGSWERVGPDAGRLPGPMLGMVSIGRYLLATIDGDRTDVIYRSSDGGLDWEILYSSPIHNLVAQGPNLYGINPANFRMIISPDSGVDWSLGGDSLDHFGIRGNRIVAATRNASLLRSEDGGTSFAPLPPPANMWVTDLAANGEAVLAGTLDAGVFRSPERSGPSPSDRWPWVSALPMQIASSLFMDGDYVLAHFYKRLFRSADGGGNWMELTTPGGADIFGSARKVAFLDGYFFMVTPSCLFRSPDSAATWVCVHPGDGDNAPTPPLLRTERGYFLGGLRGVYRSSDSGKQWERASAGLTGDVRAIASRSDTLFAAGGGGVFRSIDRGQSWERRDRGDTGFSILCAAGSALVAARKGFLYRSPDDGATWLPFLEGMIVDGASSPVPITALAVSDTFLYAGTAGTGVWSRPLAEAVSGTANRKPVMGRRAAVEGMRLLRGADGYRLAFTLGNPGKVRVDAFDAHGRKSAAAGEVFLESGTHSLALTGMPSRSGLRILVLRAGGSAHRLKTISGI